MFSHKKVADSDTKPADEETSTNTDAQPGRQWKRKWSPRFATGAVVVTDPNTDLDLASNNSSSKRWHN